MSEGQWRIEYENDTGPNDEGFFQWWVVTDGQRSFRSNAATEAGWLCEILNIITPRIAETGNRSDFDENCCAVVEIENLNSIMQAIMAQSIAYFADELNTGEYVSGGASITRGAEGTLKLTSDLVIKPRTGE